ncbi:hypothetical protein BDZ91DRAFT_763269 [Kalaharituber pfeilii]|nr:hypothetical protein BDZ91DRAFT_763269 [Kalaharituber pfeilii]
MEGGGEAAGSTVRVVAGAAAEEAIGGIGGRRWDEAVGRVGGPVLPGPRGQLAGLAEKTVRGTLPDLPHTKTEVIDLGSAFKLDFYQDIAIMDPNVTQGFRVQAP